MAKVDIWMPIFIGDYLSDTTELTGAEHGAYLLLLMHYWSKKGEIGSDIERLARVCRSDVETCSFILGSYFTLESGNYKNKRADEEMEIAESRRLASSENGKKGGRPPKNNLGKTDRLSVGNLEKSSSPSPSPLPLQEYIREREEPRDDFTTRFESIKSIWNERQLKPPMKKTIFDLMQDERTAIAGTFRNYSNEEISLAMNNYALILASTEHCVENPYRGLVGFIRGGVEKFVQDADPWRAFKKKAKGFESAGEREERERAEAMVRISAMAEGE